MSMDHPDRIEGLTPAELEAEVAEALPERALMSTVSLTGADPTADAVDAVTDSVVTTATAAAGDPSLSSDGTAQPTPQPTGTVEQPVPPESVETAATETAGTVEETVPAVDDTVATAAESVPPVDDTVATAAESVPPVDEVVATAAETVPPVDDTVATVNETLPAVDDTIGTAGEAVDLPTLLETLGETSLLDLNLDLDLDLDAAAPIQATVAANANVAAPIDAAVSANILSPGSISLATAEQQALLSQTLMGEANATSNQVSDIDQGEAAAEVQPAPADAAPAVPATVSDLAGDALPAAEDVAETAPATTGESTTDPVEAVDSGALLDVDLDLDLDLDVAAPISAAIAANANVAAPIDAAVSANVLSPQAVSLANASQDALIMQTLVGEANATSNQTSAITQGEDSDES